MQEDDKTLIELGDNSRKVRKEFSTVASQFSLLDITNEPGSTLESEEGPELAREAGELRIKGVEFTNQALNEIIHKVLDKVKSHHISQKRIIHNFFEVLTFIKEYLNNKMDAKDPNIIFKQEIGEPLLIGDKEMLSPGDKRKLCELVDRIEETVKKNYEMLQSDEIDEFVNSLLMNDEKKKNMSDEFKSDNFDNLITKLFDYIMKLVGGSDIDCEKNNDVFDIILENELRQYIDDKLQTLTSVEEKY